MRLDAETQKGKCSGKGKAAIAAGEERSWGTDGQSK